MRIRENFNKDKVFFTSDTHMGHKNIIEFCNRPFHDEFYMDEALIENWNKVVPEDGVVFHAGDFAMTARIDYIKEITDRLNGRIFLTLGNHDIQNRLDRDIFKTMFAGIDDAYYLTIQDDELESKHMDFMIFHYPIMFWRRGYVHLHGHVHSGPNSTANEKVPFHPLRYDIGVDNNLFTPIAYHQLKVILTKNSMK